MPAEPGYFDRLAYLTTHLDQAAHVGACAKARGEVETNDFIAIRRCLVKALAWLPETEQ